MSRWALLALMVVGQGCSTAPVDYHRGPLANQVMRPLPGHTGLVNSQCMHDPKTGKCAWDYVEYDLADAPTRERLRNAGFICEVGGKAYRIAQDLPGLIFETYDQTCFIGICGARHEHVLDYIPITEYQSLIDRKTECFSVFTYHYYDGGSS